MVDLYNESFNSIKRIYQCYNGQLSVEQCIDKYFTAEEPETVEIDTRGQADNPYWHAARIGRVTGTRLDCFSKCMGKPEKEFKYATDVLFKKTELNIYCRALKLNPMNYGNAYESVVFKMIKFLNPSKCFLCPGIIPFRLPYSMFAASLDCVEIAKTETSSQYLGNYYEIKCLYSCRLDEVHVFNETYSQSYIENLLMGVGKLSSKLFAKYTYCTGDDTSKLKSKEQIEFFHSNKKSSRTVAYVFKYKERQHYNGNVSVCCELSDGIEFGKGKIILNPLHSYCKQMLMESESIRQLNGTSDLNQGYLCSMISAKAPVNWQDKNVYMDRVSYDDQTHLFKVNSPLYAYLPKILVVTEVVYHEPFIKETLEPIKEAYIRNTKRLLESN